MTEDKIRDNTGKFKKGVSGNASGRPKSDKLTQKDKDELAEVLRNNIKDSEILKKVLTLLVERAELVSDIHKYFKEYAPYLMPKLSQIDSKVQEIKTITITVKGFDTVSLDTPKAKIINGEIEHDKKTD